MKIAKAVRSCAKCLSLLLVSVVLQCLAAQGQIAGNNVVYNASGMVPSTSFIDASVLDPGGDICAKIYTALSNLNTDTTQYPAGAAVIDARGITSNLSCATGTTPWWNLSTYLQNSAVILLPPGTIGITTTWLMPSRTKIIGEGAGGNGSFVTTIQATGTWTTGAAMIQMGAIAATQTYICPGSPAICFGIGIEDLRLDGQGMAVNGIVNDASQELSCVNRVDLYNIKGIGLLVGTLSGGISSSVTGNSKAQNSGPYTNIKFENTTSTNVGIGTECVQIVGAPTRGVHGLSCSASTPAVADAAVVLDAANNSIEDVLIVGGFTDGVILGANSASTGATENGDILLNVAGSPGSNLIHICKQSGTGNCATNTGTVLVTDLSILGAYDLSSSTTTIRDEETNTPVAASSDSHVGAYILGEQVTVGGSTTAWSRFTTSPRWPTWLTGSGLASGSCPTNAKGAIYSNTSGTTVPTAIYVCTGMWTGI